VQAADFDLKALHAALDAERRTRGLNWKAVAGEISRLRTRLRPIAVSSISGLASKPGGEGDGILQMLLWLRRTPESFMSGAPDPGSVQFTRPSLVAGQILRWDTRALYEAAQARRVALGLTWAEAGRQIGGFTANMLTNLANGGRIGFPRVMRLVRWLDRPAATFTRVAEW
jgi:hypothetical protein